MNYELIKVCGMRNSENIRQIAELGVNWIGLVFCEDSPRNVTMIPTHAGIIPDRSSIHQSLSAQDQYKRVGVFVDEMAQNIITRVVNFQLDIVQLNGHETPTLIRNLRSTLADIRPVKFIKAISVETREDIADYQNYADCVDYLLFDIKCPTVDDNGNQARWSMLDAYDGDLPFLLSGDIGPDDIERLKAFDHPKCIGLNLDRKFEVEPGLKDAASLRHFLAQLSH